MGFWKAVGCIAAGVAAVAAAPVVLSAAAVAGTAALGAAAAAGTAAVGAVGTAASAAGVAVTGVAGALGTATTVTVGEAMIVGAGAGAITNLGQSFLDNVVKKKVKPLTGSIVHCDLMAGLAEHSGVFTIGKIVELEGSGSIREINPETFMGSSIMRTAISIYVACNAEGEVLNDYNISLRAREMVRKKRDYNLILDNCHQFTSGCITGNFENADNFFWMLNETISKELNDGEPVVWLVWDR